MLPDNPFLKTKTQDQTGYCVSCLFYFHVQAVCVRPRYPDCLFGDDGTNLTVEPTFGCVQWEAKD